MANNNSGRDKNEKDLVCSFCGKHQDEVERMIIGPGVNICSECIGLCHDLLSDKPDQPKSARPARGGANRAHIQPADGLDINILTPAEIKEGLDQYVIGQDEAKRVLAVSVYNHYKRILSGKGGDVELQGVDPDHFLTVLDSLSEAGCAIIKTASTVRLTSTGRLTAPRPVVTQPYPGFPTDAQPPLMAACLKAKGTTVFTENIFTNRYRHAEEFRRLGAAVSIEGRVAYVTGVDRLTGAPLTSSDLRGGAAMIVAGLSAEGETEILDNGYINRGYDRFDACLSALGADVRCAAPR